MKKGHSFIKVAVVATSGWLRTILLFLTGTTAALPAAIAVNQSGDAGKPALSKLPKQNSLVSLGWGGYVDTDLKFEEFFAQDHTVWMRFMPEYPFAYAGPLLAENGTGTYLVGQGEYRWGKGGYKKAGAPVLFMNIGGKHVAYDLSALEQAPPSAKDAEVLADFEADNYVGWTIEGTCFGLRPAKDKIGNQNSVSGWRGTGFVNTYNPDDRAVGKATSRPFRISKRYIHFLIGGGRHPGRCCLNLLVGGGAVVSATGHDREDLVPMRWDVSRFRGQNATLQIVDTETGGWGHILVDQIVFSDSANAALIYPGLLRGRWHQLATVRAGKTFKLYLNGMHLLPDLEGPGADLPSGTLRLGRRTAGARIPNVANAGQFYGLIDDVAVYKRALSEEQVKALAFQERLTGEEKDLYAGWCFDVPGAKEAPLPPVLSRPVNLGQTHTLQKVASLDRDDLADGKLMDTHEPRVKMHLPFPVGEAWEVIQGYDDPGGSHNGFASFCWDFALAGRPGDTKGRPFVAAAPGVAVFIEDNQPSGGREPNLVVIKQAEEEFAAYMHGLQGTASTTLKRGTLPQLLPEKDQPRVRAGQPLAGTGDSGVPIGAVHLHFAVLNLPDINQNAERITIPAAFSDYQASDDRGKTWYAVSLGGPRNGQWVKRVR